MRVSDSDRQVTSSISQRLPKALFVIGATSSGKTELGVHLAKKFDGEIINADARQVYARVNIGTGKPIGARGTYRRHGAFLYKEIPHYLMDFLPPQETYSAPEWRASAMKAIEGISKRKHLPIVVGGTGLYISSIIDHLSFPNIGPQQGLRDAYDKKDLGELVRLLQAIDPDAIPMVDVKNKRRVIRALEISTFSGQRFSELRKKGDPLVDALQIGIDRSLSELADRANQTIEDMVARGLVEEVRMLLKQGISPNAPAMTALGYRDFAKYLDGEITLHQAVEQLKKQTRAYIRRQRTWFKRDKRIVWVKDEKEAEKVVKAWLKRVE